MNHRLSPHLLALPCLLALSACDDPQTPSPTPTPTATLTVTVHEEPESGVRETTYQTTADFQFRPGVLGDLSPEEQVAWNLLNAERQRGGICTAPNGQVTRHLPQPPLQLEARIYEAARLYGESLRRWNVAGVPADHYDPSDPAGQTPARRMIRAGYRPAPPTRRDQALFFEENLAFGHDDAAQVLKAWKTESYAHCETLYAPAQYGAFSLTHSPSGTKFKRYWVLNVSGIR